MVLSVSISPYQYSVSISIRSNQYSVSVRVLPYQVSVFVSIPSIPVFSIHQYPTILVFSIWQYPSLAVFPHTPVLSIHVFQYAFREPEYSMIKTTVMMIGEMEFQDLFFGTEDVDDPEDLHKNKVRLPQSSEMRCCRNQNLMGQSFCQVYACQGACQSINQSNKQYVNQSSGLAREVVSPIRWMLVGPLYTI